MKNRDGNAGRDRRRVASTVRNRPRSSPASLLILGVAGVLAASAVAAALLGNALENTTPHGQVLSSLQVVANAQEDHYRRTGEFAGWIHSLEVEVFEGVDVGLIRASATEWEAMASHAVGLTCIQGGRVEAGRPQREAPVCYTNSGD